jgi:hypothetical protein
MAEDELARACSLSWRELSKVTPWGDTFDGVSPAGRNVQVERSYLWADQPGGDVLCEVRVYANAALYDAGEAVSRRVRRS